MQRTAPQALAHYLKASIAQKEKKSDWGYHQLVKRLADLL
jgi:hypothetical protein